MERRKFVKVLGMSAFAISSTGFTLVENNSSIITDCATSTDMLGPFFRKGAPKRNEIGYKTKEEETPIIVKGRVYGADCKTPLTNVEIDIWHCDHNKKYDMESKEFKCRGKIFSDEHGKYWFKTFIPPPYGGRPKHIHYLINQEEGFQNLATQIYFKGDNRIKKDNWIKYPWDEKRILEIYKNEDQISEVTLDLYLAPTT